MLSRVFELDAHRTNVLTRSWDDMRLEQIIVWQLFQAIQIIQISSNYVEFNMGKTRCVLK